MAKKKEISPEDVLVEQPKVEVTTEQAIVELPTIETTSEQPAVEAETEQAKVETGTEQTTVEQPTVEVTTEEAESETEHVECMYCGISVQSDVAITDHNGKTFCSQEHADTYAQTMKQINHTY